MIMLIGEAWGRDEEEARAPFVGASGRLLNALLAASGISRSECYLTNVFNFRPRPTNDVINLCGPKEDGIPGYPALAKGRYVNAKYAPELMRLHTEIKRTQPTLIIAMGVTPMWATLKTTGIKKMRGAPFMSSFGIKVLPTYHPAAALREFKLRPIIYADLKKAVHEATFPEVVYPKREVWIEPTLTDLEDFEEQYIVPSPELSVDVETYGEQVTCISIAPRLDVAIVVPFVDFTKPSRSYWPSLDEEVTAWRWVKRICQLGKRLVGQNFLYDLGFLWRSYGFPVYDMAEDTMLLHHALQPEMEKSLDFLASIYTTEQKWKWMRKSKTLKKED